MSLATKYRPRTFEEVTEQSVTTSILRNQLANNEIKNAYLFCGGAGTGKTTCARIFANEINKGVGTPIELDAASNNSVDDVRNLIEQAQTASIDSEYKVFIMDEVHALSNSAWQAMLKILEEPPKKSIFIMCTTNPEKIPKTILSRVQRYDFQRISQKGVFDRLIFIANEEKEINDSINWYGESLEYIARLSEGGMRDAITMLEKCLLFSEELTIDNVMSALGCESIPRMIQFAIHILEGNLNEVFNIISTIHTEGKDLKLFVRQFSDFLLDTGRAYISGKLDHTKLPNTQEVNKWVDSINDEKFNMLMDLLDCSLSISRDIKWDSSPKSVIEARYILFSRKE